MENSNISNKEIDTDIASTVESLLTSSNLWQVFGVVVSLVVVGGGVYWFRETFSTWYKGEVC